MIKFLSLVFCCALTPALLSQQTTAPAPPSPVAPAAVPSPCTTHYAGGATFGPSASPKVTGFAALITLLPGITCDPTKDQPHSYTQYIESPVKVNGVWTLEQTVSTGLAISSTLFGPVKAWLLGTAGTTVVGSTSQVKLGTTVGIVADIPLGKKKSVTLLPGFELVNGNKEGILGVMF